MSDSADAGQRQWLLRVLGFELPPSRAPGGEGRAAAIAAWRDASDEVDGQIGKLQAALRNSGDAELAEIAEFGLNGVTGGFKVPLLAALREVSGAGNSASPELLIRARRLAIGFGEHLRSDQRVRGCDENPFRVHVAIAATLGTALDRLASALAPPG